MKKQQQVQSLLLFLALSETNQACNSKPLEVN